MTEVAGWGVERLSMLIEVSCSVVYRAQNPGGVSCNDGVRRHVTRNDTARANDRALPDRHIGKDGRARSDRGAFLDHGRFHFPIVRRLQITSRRRRPRVGVVDKDHTVSNEHVIFNRHAFTNKRVTRDFAALTNAGALLNFNKGADFRFVANLTTVEVDEFGKPDVFPEFYVGSNAVVIHVRGLERAYGMCAISAP